MADERRRPQLPETWLRELQPAFDSPRMQSLRAFLVQEKAKFRVFPPGNEIFAAFAHTPLDRVRVVVLGQDPYHGPGQAHGLCFSVRRGVDIPPSLQNIYRELREDVGVVPPAHGDLSAWADRGVLLLNATLTVREHQANSHRGQGWEEFTDRVVEVVDRCRDGLAFVLWGSAAQKKAERIDRRRHFVVQSPHPSPLSAHRGFLGSKPFSAINRWFEGRGEAPIDWSLPA